jgi:hypothetical protein
MYLSEAEVELSKPVGIVTDGMPSIISSKKIVWSLLHKYMQELGYGNFKVKSTTMY